jgi:hypothetical protein
MGDILRFDGMRNRAAVQDTEPRNINKVSGIKTGNRAMRPFYTNPGTQMRLWPAVDSSDSADSLIRKLGGKRALLYTLKAASPTNRPTPPACGRKAA